MQKSRHPFLYYYNSTEHNLNNFLSYKSNIICNYNLVFQDFSIILIQGLYNFREQNINLFKGLESLMSNQQQRQQYQKNYEEFHLLGRGNYGAAYLVKNNIDGNHYVAKKMMLEGMAERQIALAWGEIQILQKFNNLNIPFIVEYKECFHFQNTLIIIMQYCQHGDLATFLKNYKKKGEYLDQRIIVNWFIQLLFGVKALHSKNVLHRDLKAANVFLTSNKTLKIGDFGISKVLDNTSAKTFVGTPYYLSPQVCENRPYNLASDLWSLGCIVYQLCTLTYPFQASNILGLAMKILSDDVKPIPAQYSKELNDIVMKLFNKNQKQRITIDEILKNPFIKKHMATFVEDQEKINKLIQIGKKQIKPQEDEEVKAEKTIDANDDTMKTINSVLESTGKKQSTLSYSQSLTPKQRLKLKKQEENRRRQAELREASMKNASFRNFAKEKKYQTLATSNNNFNKSNVLQKQLQNQNKQKAQLSKTRNRLEKMQVINTEQLSETVNKLRTLKSSNVQFEEVTLPQGMETLSLTNTYDQRPIKPRKQEYKIDEEIEQYEELEEYFDEGFQDYIEQEPRVKSTATREQFEEIKAFYQNQMGNSNISPTKKSRIAEAFKTQDMKLPSSPNNKIKVKEQECIELVGKESYLQLYKKVKNQKIEYKNMKNVYTPEQIRAIKIIDEIIYYESF